jgi:hypothetical protein
VVCVRLYEITIAFFMMIFHPPFAKDKKERKSCALSFSATKSAHKLTKKMLGFITNRLLNALNCTYAPYASCKALMSVTPDDDVKWYNFLLSLFISIIVT